MALSKTALGAALKTGMAQFNNVQIDTTDPSAMDTYRSQYWEKMADIIITHFTTNGVLTVPGLGLNAGSVAVTGNSITGKLS